MRPRLDDPAVSTGTTDEVPRSLLRCGSCGRRWLADGDHRDDGPTRCPFCGGDAGVLGVHG